MVMLAFVEQETGWVPCQVAEVKRGNTFYLVKDGKKGSVLLAIADAKQINDRDESSWVVDAKPVE